MKLDWNKKYTTIAAYAFLVLAGTALFCGLLFKISEIKQFFLNIALYLEPFVYGFVLAYLMSPLLRIIEGSLPRGRLKPGFRRTMSMLLAYLVVLSLLALFLLLAIPPLVDSITSIVQNMSTYADRAKNISDAIQDFINLESMPKEIADAVNDIFAYLYGMLSTVLLYLVGLTTRLTSGILNFTIGIIISIYMLRGKERLIAQLKKILYAFFPEKFVGDLISLTHDSNTKFSGFLSGKVLDSAIIGAMCLVGMYLFRMPFPELISLIVGVTNIIPYFGPIVGAIPGFLLIIISGNVGQAFGYLAFILLLQQFDGNILGPAILGQTTGLSAMWVMFAILLFGGLYGFVGMIIGVPLLSVIFGTFRAIANQRLKRKGLSIELEEYASEDHPLID